MTKFKAQNKSKIQMTNTKTKDLDRFKRSMLCKVVAWVLILAFTITNVTYGYERVPRQDHLKSIRPNESTALQKDIEGKFKRPPVIGPKIKEQIGKAVIVALIAVTIIFAIGAFGNSIIAGELVKNAMTFARFQELYLKWIYLAGAAVALMFVMPVGFRAIKRLTQPIEKMEKAAAESVWTEAKEKTEEGVRQTAVSPEMRLRVIKNKRDYADIEFNETEGSPTKDIKRYLEWAVQRFGKRKDVEIVIPYGTAKRPYGVCVILRKRHILPWRWGDDAELRLWKGEEIELPHENIGYERINNIITLKSTTTMPVEYSEEEGLDVSTDAALAEYMRIIEYHNSQYLDTLDESTREDVERWDEAKRRRTDYLLSQFSAVIEDLRFKGAPFFEELTYESRVRFCRERMKTAQAQDVYLEGFRDPYFAWGEAGQLLASFTSSFLAGALGFPIDTMLQNEFGIIAEFIFFWGITSIPVAIFFMRLAYEKMVRQKKETDSEEAYEYRRNVRGGQTFRTMIDLKKRSSGIALSNLIYVGTFLILIPEIFKTTYGTLASASVLFTLVLVNSIVEDAGSYYQQSGWWTALERRLKDAPKGTPGHKVSKDFWRLIAFGSRLNTILAIFGLWLARGIYSFNPTLGIVLSCGAGLILIWSRLFVSFFGNEHKTLLVMDTTIMTPEYLKLPYEVWGDVYRIGKGIWITTKPIKIGNQLVVPDIHKQEIGESKILFFDKEPKITLHKGSKRLFRPIWRPGQSGSYIEIDAGKDNPAVRVYYYGKEIEEESLKSYYHDIEEKFMLIIPEPKGRLARKKGQSPWQFAKEVLKEAYRLFHKQFLAGTFIIISFVVCINLFLKGIFTMVMPALEVAIGALLSAIRAIQDPTKTTTSISADIFYTVMGMAAVIFIGYITLKFIKTQRQDPKKWEVLKSELPDDGPRPKERGFSQVHKFQAELVSLENNSLGHFEVSQFTNMAGKTKEDLNLVLLEELRKKKTLGGRLARLFNPKEVRHYLVYHFDDDRKKVVDGIVHSQVMRRPFRRKYDAAVFLWHPVKGWESPDGFELPLEDMIPKGTHNLLVERDLVTTSDKTRYSTDEVLADYNRINEDLPENRERSKKIREYILADFKEDLGHKLPDLNNLVRYELDKKTFGQNLDFYFRLMRLSPIHAWDDAGAFHHAFFSGFLAATLMKILLDAAGSYLQVMNIINLAAMLLAPIVTIIIITRSMERPNRYDAIRKGSDTYTKRRGGRGYRQLYRINAAVKRMFLFVTAATAAILILYMVQLYMPIFLPYAGLISAKYGLTVFLGIYVICWVTRSLLETIKLRYLVDNQVINKWTFVRYNRPLAKYGAEKEWWRFSYFRSNFTNWLWFFGSMLGLWMFSAHPIFAFYFALFNIFLEMIGRLATPVYGNQYKSFMTVDELAKEEEVRQEGRVDRYFVFEEAGCKIISAQPDFMTENFGSRSVIANPHEENLTFFFKDEPVWKPKRNRWFGLRALLFAEEGGTLYEIAGQNRPINIRLYSHTREVRFTKIKIPEGDPEFAQLKEKGYQWILTFERLQTRHPKFRSIITTGIINAAKMFWSRYKKPAIAAALIGIAFTILSLSGYPLKYNLILLGLFAPLAAVMTAHYLDKLGIDPRVKYEVIREHQGETLFGAQQSILEQGLCEALLDKSVFVEAPTGSGKSTFPVLARALARLAKNLEDRTVILVPKKAIGAERMGYFKGICDAVGIRVLYSDGVYREDDVAILRGNFDIAIMIQEKLDFFESNNPEFFNQVTKEVVFDELAAIGDEERGLDLELNLSALLQLYKDKVKVLGLARPLGGVEEMAQKMGASSIKTQERPIELPISVWHKGMLYPWDPNTRKCDTEKSTPLELRYPTVRIEETLADLKKRYTDLCEPGGRRLMVFVPRRWHVVRDARRLAGSLKELEIKGRLRDALDELNDKQNKRDLEYCLQRGVSFHHGDMTVEERRVAEIAFREGYAHTIFCTETLDEGVNLPADMVFFAHWGGDPEHPGATHYERLGPKFTNCAGRAGRQRDGLKPVVIYPALSLNEVKCFDDSIATQLLKEIDKPRKESDLNRLILKAIMKLTNAKKSAPTLDDIIALFLVTPTALLHENRKEYIRRKAEETLLYFVNPDRSKILAYARDAINNILKRDKGGPLGSSTAQNEIGNLDKFLVLLQDLYRRAGPEAPNDISTFITNLREICNKPDAKRGLQLSRDKVDRIFKPIKELIENPGTLSLFLSIVDEAAGEEGPQYITTEIIEGKARFKLTDFGRLVCAHRISIDTCDAFYKEIKGIRERGVKHIITEPLVNILYTLYNTKDGKKIELLETAFSRSELEGRFREYKKKTKSWTVEIKRGHLLVTLLAMADWVEGISFEEIEKKYKLTSGSLYKVSGHFAWLLRAYRDVCKKADEKFETDNLEELATKLSYGLPIEAIPLNQLGIFGLTRDWIIPLVRAVKELGIGEGLPIEERVVLFAEKEEEKAKSFFPNERFYKKTIKVIKKRMERHEPLAKNLIENPDLIKEIYSLNTVQDSLVKEARAGDKEQARNTPIRRLTRDGQHTVFRKYSRRGKEKTPLRISRKEDVQEAVKRGAVEFLTGICREKEEAGKILYVTDYLFFDIDPQNTPAGDKYLMSEQIKVIKAVYEKLKKNNLVGDIEIRWTGGKGFHILAHLKDGLEMPIETIKGMCEDIKGGICDGKRVVDRQDPLRLDPHIVIDLSQLNRAGQHRSLYSIHAKSGGVCMPVPYKYLDDFEPDMDANIYGAMKTIDAIAVFAHIKEAKRIWVANFEVRKVGEAVSGLTMLVASILRSVPNIDEIVVVSQYPELVKYISPKVRTVRPEDFNPKSEIDTGRKPDIIIDFQMYLHPYVEDLCKDAHYLPNFSNDISYPILLYNEEILHRYKDTDYTFFDVNRKSLTRLGLKVPPHGEPIFPGREVRNGVVFVNLHSVTNRAFFDDLRRAWANLITELLKRRYKVVLNYGTLSDSENTEWIEKEVRGSAGEDAKNLEIKKFVSTEELVDYLYSSVERVITIDTGIFHVAHKLCGIPTSVITTPRSAGWISPTEKGFTQVSYDRFINFPTEVIPDDAGKAPKGDGSVYTGSLFGAAQALNPKWAGATVGGALALFLGWTYKDAILCWFASIGANGALPWIITASILTFIILPIISLAYYTHAKENLPLGAWWKDTSKTYMAISLPIYSLRRDKDDPGIGKFTDLARYYKDVLHNQGIDIVLLLPHYAVLNESPYAPVSLYALNKLYIDWAEVEEVKKDKSLLEQLKAPTLNEQQSVHYKAVREREKKVAYAAYKRFTGREAANKAIRAQEYLKFVDENREWLDDYAEFMAIRNKGEIEVYKFSQWIAYSQLRDAVSAISQYGGRVLFDIPMFRARESADVVMHPEYFNPAGNPGIIRPGLDENWVELIHWNWRRLKDENYEFMLRPIRHWLDFGFDGARIDGLHFAYNFGYGQLVSGNEPGEEYVTALGKVFGKYDAFPLAEAYEGLAGEAQKHGFVTVYDRVYRSDWQQLSHHDEPRWYASLQQFVDTIKWFLDPNCPTYLGRTARFVSHALGDLWGEIFGIKEKREGKSYWRYRIPLSSDPDYHNRARFAGESYLSELSDLRKKASSGDTYIGSLFGGAQGLNPKLVGAIFTGVFMLFLGWTYKDAILCWFVSIGANGALPWIVTVSVLSFIILPIIGMTYYNPPEAGSRPAPEDTDYGLGGPPAEPDEVPFMFNKETTQEALDEKMKDIAHRLSATNILPTPWRIADGLGVSIERLYFYFAVKFKMHPSNYDVIDTEINERNIVDTLAHIRSGAKIPTCTRLVRETGAKSWSDIGTYLLDTLRKGYADYGIVARLNLSDAIIHEAVRELREGLKLPTFKAVVEHLGIHRRSLKNWLNRNNRDTSSYGILPDELSDEKIKMAVRLLEENNERPTMDAVSYTLGVTRDYLTNYTIGKDRKAYYGIKSARPVINIDVIKRAIEILNGRDQPPTANNIAQMLGLSDAEVLRSWAKEHGVDLYQLGMVRDEKIMVAHPDRVWLNDFLNTATDETQSLYLSIVLKLLDKGDLSLPAAFSLIWAILRKAALSKDIDSEIADSLTIDPGEISLLLVGRAGQRYEFPGVLEILKGALQERITAGGVSQDTAGRISSCIDKLERMLVRGRAAVLPTEEEVGDTLSLARSVVDRFPHLTIIDRSSSESEGGRRIIKISPEFKLEILKKRCEGLSYQQISDIFKNMYGKGPDDTSLVHFFKGRSYYSERRSAIDRFREEFYKIIGSKRIGPPIEIEDIYRVAPTRIIELLGEEPSMPKKNRREIMDEILELVERLFCKKGRVAKVFRRCLNYAENRRYLCRRLFVDIIRIALERNITAIYRDEVARALLGFFLEGGEGLPRHIDQTVEAIMNTFRSEAPVVNSEAVALLFAKVYTHPDSRPFRDELFKAILKHTTMGRRVYDKFLSFARPDLFVVKKGERIPEEEERRIKARKTIIRPCSKHKFDAIQRKLREFERQIEKRNRLIDDFLTRWKATQAALYMCPWAKKTKSNTRGFTDEELTSIGEEALVDATTAYDPARGASFDTFATEYIGNAVRRAFHETVRALERRTATETEIEPRGEEEERFFEQMPALQVEPLTVIAKKEDVTLKDLVRIAEKMLDERELMVFKLVHGIDEKQGEMVLSYEEIGGILFHRGIRNPRGEALSREMIRNIYNEAQYKFQEAIYKELIKVEQPQRLIYEWRVFLNNIHVAKRLPRPIDVSIEPDGIKILRGPEPGTDLVLRRYGRYAGRVATVSIMSVEKVEFAHNAYTLTLRVEVDKRLAGTSIVNARRPVGRFQYGFEEVDIILPGDIPTLGAAARDSKEFSPEFQSREISYEGDNIKIVWKNGSVLILGPNGEKVLFISHSDMHLEGILSVLMEDEDDELARRAGLALGDIHTPKASLLLLGHLLAIWQKIDRGVRQKGIEVPELPPIYLIGSSVIGKPEADVDIILPIEYYKVDSPLVHYRLALAYIFNTEYKEAHLLKPHLWNDPNQIFKYGHIYEITPKGVWQISANGNKIAVIDSEGPVSRGTELQRKEFYVKLLQNVKKDFEGSGKVCHELADEVLGRLRQHGIKARKALKILEIGNEKIIQHAWVVTEDGYLLDVFPEEAGLSEVASRLGHRRIIVTNDKGIIELYYKEIGDKVSTTDIKFPTIGAAGVEQDIHMLVNLAKGEYIDSSFLKGIHIQVRMDKRYTRECEIAERWLEALNRLSNSTIRGEVKTNGSDNNGLIKITAWRNGWDASDGSPIDKKEIGKCSITIVNDVDNIPRITALLNMAFAASIIPDISVKDKDGKDIISDDWRPDYLSLFIYINDQYRLITGQDYLTEDERALLYNNPGLEAIQNFINRIRHINLPKIEPMGEEELKRDEEALKAV